MLGAYSLPCIGDTVGTLHRIFNIIYQSSALTKLKSKTYINFTHHFRLRRHCTYLYVYHFEYNRVVCFQRTIDNSIEDEKVHTKFPILDNLIYVGKTNMSMI